MNTDHEHEVIMQQQSGRLYEVPVTSWQIEANSGLQQRAVAALESGQVLFFPELKFSLTPEELRDLCHARVSSGTKNVSYNFNIEVLRGSEDNAAMQARIQEIMKRYALAAQHLVASLFPQYMSALQIGRTSLRPVEIAGRVAPSYRKDDTRLHVDAFPASPNQGRRILRVFYNYNPEGQPRVWRVGEAFANLAARFLPKFRAPFWGERWLLKTLRITRGERTPYDHYMLHLHNGMKYDEAYQQRVAAETIKFPAGSTWMVYTDCVSHAALSGQHVLEQTFYLPVTAMVHPELSPLQILERLTARSLL